MARRASSFARYSGSDWMGLLPGQLGRFSSGPVRVVESEARPMVALSAMLMNPEQAGRQATAQKLFARQANCREL